MTFFRRLRTAPPQGDAHSDVEWAQRRAAHRARLAHQQTHRRELEHEGFRRDR
ncbi:hypothetical protein [Aeromicrobium sp. CF3.5]|uniref:hypothetical protein n=1 Tax=Aeromicrobium sp. CF3.5 TaxID=3373078 RepID=UPI003EE4EDF3